MSPIKRWLIILAVGGLAWWLASWRFINASECFYFAVPLTALAYYLTGRKDPADNSEPSLPEYGVRNGVAMLGAVILLGVCCLSWIFGTRVLQSWRYWLEFGTAVYLMASAYLLILGGLRLVLAATQWLVRRWPHRRLVGNVLFPAAALSLFVLVAIPFGVAFSFVYRVKLPNVFDPQTDLGRPYEEVEFVCADGTTISGWWMPARTPSARTMIYCHGLAANRTQTLHFHELADWLDANLFLFDMRGHGDSAGRAGSLGLRERDDVLSAIAYVRRHHPGESRQLIGMGISLGAALLADVAAEVEPPLDGLILDSGFTATGDMTQSLPLPPFCRGWLLTVGLPIANWNAGCTITNFRPVTNIARVRAPVVLFHSRHDFITPSEHSLRLYEHAVEPKQLAILDVEGHCNSFFCRRDEYREAIRWFAERLPK